jgi:hypothetical protein
MAFRSAARARAAAVSGLLVAWMPFWQALACGDVDVDGDFDTADVQLYRTWLADLSPPTLAGLAQCTVIGPSRPCDVLNFAVMARSLAAQPPGIGNVCQDDDQDGLSGPTDTCPGSPSGAAAVGAGCTAIDLVLRPEPVTDPPGAVLGEAISLLGYSGLGTSTEVQSLASGAGAATLEFENAEALLRAGDPCAASATWSSALSALQSQRAAFAAELTRVRLEIVGAQGAWSADHFGDGVLAIPALAAGLAELDEGIAAAATSGGLLVSACAAVTGAVSVEGRISRVDDAARVIHLEGGQVFALGGSGSPTGGPGGFSVGQDVVVNGTGFQGAAGGPGSGIATSVTPVDPGSPGDLEAGYLFLRVAPVQGFPPFSSEPITLHHPAAYTRPDGTLALERGSRLAFVGVVNTKASPQWTRYSAEIWIDYLSAKYPIASDLETGKLPAALPSNVPNDAAATLHFRVRKQFCQPGTGLLTPPCGAFQNVRSESYPVRIYARGEQCDTVIPVATADLEDNDFVGFRWSVVDNVLVNPAVVDGATSFAFEGQSCIAIPGAESCDGGQIVTTAEGEPYRIYTHDFFPVHRGAGLGGALGTVTAFLKHGVTTFSGLRWPHVRGTRNGTTFWYSCATQRIVRDVVDYCPAAAEDSYYRYPLFPGGAGGWLLGKGNGDGPPPAHSGGQFYAFDIGAPLGHEIRAARGGRAVVVEEDESDTSLTTDGEIETELCFERLANCFALASQGPCSTDADCTSPQYCSWNQCVFSFSANACNFQYPCNIGNYVWVRHQDETIGVYFHLRENGAAVAYNDVVKRSNKVGEVGDTGYSYGEHLHFEAHRLDLGSSIRSRFQTAAFQTPNTCWVPQNGDPLPSNNDPSAFF